MISSIQAANAVRGSSLDDLEATIGGIEARLDRIRAKPASQPHSYSDEIADRMRMLANQVAGMGGQSQPAQQPRNPRQSPRAQEGLARDIERMRRDETDQTQMNAIFAELQSLRGDMKRLTAPSQQDDWGLALGREIESLKQGIGALAREDTLRSVENRWSEHAQPTRTSLQDDPIIETLIDRIDNIQSAVNGLPQSLSITSLEEKVRILASAIDQMSRRSPEFNPEHLLQIEDRLDEISRAIVASSVSVQAVNQDKAGFDRIEARLGSLNARLDEIGNAEPAQDLQDRIANLANQMDRLAEKAGAPTDQMVRMASQMETIAEKLNQLDSRNTDVDSVTHSLEERLFDIVNRLELSQVENGRENRSLFSELEGRLEDLAARMLAPAPDNSAHILEAVEQRIAHLSHQINQSQSDNVIDPVFAKNVESRLAEITNRLNQSASAIPSTDTDAMARLEEQVMNLSHKLSSQAVPSAGNDELGLRLDSIERKLASNHEIAFDRSASGS